MSQITDDIRHERERGLIIELLIDGGLRPTPLFFLLSMMEAQGWPLGDGDPRQALKDLDVHLTYLSDFGLVERKNPREGRLNLEIQTVRAMGKALDLKSGRIAPIPGIRF